MDDLIGKDFFTDHQYGFQPGRGTLNALTACTVTSAWYKVLDSGMDVCCVFLTFERLLTVFHIQLQYTCTSCLFRV